MKTLVTVLTSGMMLAGFSVAPVSAADGLTKAERMRASSSIGYAGNYNARKHHIHHHGQRQDAIHNSRANRLNLTRNRLMYGDPNTRTPMLLGYAQQRGNTSGGPRY